MWDEIRKINSTNKKLREFGLVIASAAAILCVISLWRGKYHNLYYLIPACAIFALSGLFFPPVLKPLQKVWMTLAIIIGFFVSHAVLIILFYLVITPIGLITRMLHKDILDQKIEKARDSYWKYRDTTPAPKESYENQY